MAKQFSFDSKSLELAEYFLTDVKGASKDDRNVLAQEIQRVCEDACTEIECREIDRKRAGGSDGK